MYILQSSEYEQIKRIDQENGLVGYGGSLSPDVLIRMYALGVFPWNNETEPLMWYSPDPRMLVAPEEVYFSKQIMRHIDKDHFECRFDSAFEMVIDHCASVKRKGQEETWITPPLRQTFVSLHRSGLAHSVEIYLSDKLVGGLYGLSLGKVFFGESMFHLVPDASKVAFYHLTMFLRLHHFSMIDAQQETPYLAGFGAKAIPKRQFLERLKEAVQKPTLKGNWGADLNEIQLISIKK